MFLPSSAPRNSRCNRTGRAFEQPMHLVIPMDVKMRVSCWTVEEGQEPREEGPPPLDEQQPHPSSTSSKLKTKHTFNAHTSIHGESN